MADKIELEITNKQVIELFKEFKKIETDSNLNSNKWFSFDNIKNLECIKEAVQKIQRLNETIKPSEKILEYQDKRQEIMLALCEKEIVKLEDGTEREVPVTLDPEKTQFKFTKENFEKFKDAERDLIKDYKDEIEIWEKTTNEFNEILEEKVKIEFDGYKFEKIPDNFKIPSSLFGKLIREE